MHDQEHRSRHAPKIREGEPISALLEKLPPICGESRALDTGQSIGSYCPMHMCIVFENSDFTIVGHMKSLLDSESIPCEIRNAGAAGLAGEIPHTQVYPELWVLDKIDAPRAREIITAYRDKDLGAPKPPDWICLKCGEGVDGVFAECWNCGSSDPDESAPPAVPRSVEESPEENTLAPLADRNRVPLLDTLRGFSLFGILLVNMWGFKVPLLAYHPTENYIPGPLNELADEAVHLFAAGKFLPIFAFLFGLGLVLQKNRCEAANMPFTPFLLRRISLLLVFGLIHGIFLWPGDILAIYALFGFAAAWLLRLGPRTLCNLAGVVMLGMIICMIATPIQLSDFQQHDWRAVADQWVTAYQLAGPIGSARLHFDQWLHLWTNSFIYQIPYCFLFFLLGIAAGKAGILAKLDLVLPRGAKQIVWALPAGILLSLLWPASIRGGIPWMSGAGYILPTAFYLGSALLAMVYLVGFTFMFHRGCFPQLAAVLADAGRMSLSNYLFQSIAANIIFMGWGFGFYGKTSVIQGLVLSVLIFTIQLFISRWWIRKYQIGPIESVTRKFTANPLLLR